MRITERFRTYGYRPPTAKSKGKAGPPKAAPAKTAVRSRKANRRKRRA
jgi:hypothetical protein